MRRTLAILAAILLAASAVGCMFGSDEPENPTPDLQATVDAALARISATQAVSSADSPAPTVTISPTATPASFVSTPTATSTPTFTPSSTATTPSTFKPEPAPTLSPTATVPPMLAPTSASTSTPDSELAESERFDGPSLEKEIHQLINAERIKRRIPELIWDEQIAVIARDHSEDMASNDYFSHDNLHGESPTDRGNRSGYPCRKSLGGGVFSYGLAENIWLGWEYSSYTYWAGGSRYDWMSQSQLARQAVSSWMNSTGHRENILEPQYDRSGIGAGFGTSGGKDHAVYLTQNFC